MGDLIVTCASMHSRNRRCGILLGEGKSLKEAQEEVGMVVEGIFSAKAAIELGRKYEVSLPIIEQVNLILFEGKDPGVAVKELMLGKAEAEKEAAILKAEAEKEAAIRKAEGEAEAILKVQKANAEGIRMINDAAPQEGYLSIKSLEAMEKVADGKSTKVIIPSNLQGLAGLATTASELFKGDKAE